jgi:hypothetical protein
MMHAGDRVRHRGKGYALAIRDNRVDVYERAIATVIGATRCRYERLSILNGGEMGYNPGYFAPQIPPSSSRL